jgi:hypothetical protein
MSLTGPRPEFVAPARADGHVRHILHSVSQRITGLWHVIDLRQDARIVGGLELNPTYVEELSLRYNLSTILGRTVGAVLRGFRQLTGAPTIPDEPRATDREVERRPTAFGLWLALVAAAVLIWAAVAGLVLVRGAEQARRAQDTLGSLVAIDPLEADLDVVASDVRAAAGDLDAARTTLDSPVLWPLRPLPVLGRQLASARALSTVAADVTAQVDGLFDEVLDARRRGGQDLDRLRFLRSLEARLGRLSDSLDGARLGPDQALVGPLADARATASEQLAELGEHVGRGRVVAQGLHSFFSDGSVLVLGANQAEMQAAAGMYLTVSEASIRHGELAMEPPTNSSELFLRNDITVVSRDIADRWGFLHPTNDLRKLALTPRFAEYDGPQAIEMWHALTGSRPDSAVMMDQTVIEALLRVVGPVSVEGRTIDAESLADFLLVEQYAEFPDTEEAVQDQRTELIGQIASAALEALGERSWDPVELLRQLRPAAAGGHLRAYSTRPVEQRSWEELGIAGTVDGSEVLVSLANLGGSKLDLWVDVAVDATTTATATGTTVELDVTLVSAVPDWVQGYALGPWEWLGVEDPEPGLYIGRLHVFAPGAARQLRFIPERPLDAHGADGALRVMASTVILRPGERQALRASFELPPGVDAVRILPSARPRPVEWTWDGEPWSDRNARTVPLAP